MRMMVAMGRRANILCVGERSADMERLAIAIAGERDGVFFVTSERAGLGVVAENRPDLVIVAEYLRQGSRDNFTRLLNNGDGIAPTPVIRQTRMPIAARQAREQMRFSLATKKKSCCWRGHAR